MNNPSPLIPQGSLTDQKLKSRARVRIAVFFVLAVHGIGLLGLLMLGCRKEPEAVLPTPDTSAMTNNTNPPFQEPTNTTTAGSNTSPVMPPTGPGNVPGSGSPPAGITPETPQPPAAAGATEYKITKGDNFSTLAKKFHVTASAIKLANPGVDPTKLQIGQVVHIPAATATAPTTAPASAEPGAADQSIYVVKSGDTLGKIATAHGIKLKALMTANNLKTTTIHVGDKLKIPAKAATAPAATPPASTDTVPSAPTTSTSPSAPATSAP